MKKQLVGHRRRLENDIKWNPVLQSLWRKVVDGI